MKVDTISFGSVLLIIPMRTNQLQHLLSVQKIVVSDSTM